MIILSDCLTETVDEGCIKVAVSFAKRIKEQDPAVTVVTYERQSGLSDSHMKLNKMFLDRRLLMMIRREKEEILYIPFASNTFASSVRTWILSWPSGKRVRVLFCLRHSMGTFAKLFLKLSRAEIIALSRESYDYYRRETGNRVIYLKAGVDTDRFVPADSRKKEALRKKYGVIPGKKVVLHVGHLKKNRNIEALLKISEEYHVFLVLSSVTRESADLELREALMAKQHITVIDTYLPQIEELYQMADVYLFPVTEKEGCIDVPLSVLEAASCNIPIVAARYGELAQFTEEPGFCFLSSFEAGILNQAIGRMANYKDCRNREAVLSYDWSTSVRRLTGETK